MIDTIMGKEQFLIEHNRLSPVNLQTTIALLTKFQKAKQPLLKDADWSFELRNDFISWLLILPLLHPVKNKIKKKYVRKSKKLVFKNYPETHNQ